jgi:hypothetical protein
MLTTLKDKEEYIRKFCTTFVPSDTGDYRFKWLVADWGGKGTTCGYLAHRMAWAMGCRQNWVNCSLEGTKYRNALNISLIWNSGKPPFTLFKKGMTPPFGAITFVSNGNTYTEHVEVFDRIDAQGHWRMWAAGQSSDDGECAREKTRVFDGVNLGGRRLYGWIAPDNILCTEDEWSIEAFTGYGRPTFG